MATFKCADGIELHAHVWAPDDPRIVVAVFHGYAEHARRYEHVAKAWNARGIGVVAADLRGHGRSPGVRGHVERFTDYHRDADAIVDGAVARANGAPVVVYGHSMGGLLALHWWLARRPNHIKGLAMTSPYLGLALSVPAVKRAASPLISVVWPSFATGAGVKGSDVTRDPELAALYDRDPLNNKKATARWFIEAQAAIEAVHRRAREVEGPLLLMFGGADRVASAAANARFGAALTGAGKTVERIDDGYHELVNEPPEVRDPIIHRLGTWILERAEVVAEG